MGLWLQYLLFAALHDWKTELFALAMIFSYFCTFISLLDRTTLQLRTPSFIGTAGSYPCIFICALVDFIVALMVIPSLICLWFIRNKIKIGAK